jgi:hypothetical protein
MSKRPGTDTTDTIIVPIITTDIIVLTIITGIIITRTIITATIVGIAVTGDGASDRRIGPAHLATFRGALEI